MPVYRSLFEKALRMRTKLLSLEALKKGIAAKTPEQEDPKREALPNSETCDGGGTDRAAERMSLAPVRGRSN